MAIALIRQTLHTDIAVFHKPAYEKSASNKDDKGDDYHLA